MYAQLSILVNGSRKGFFRMGRGIRQGDPLSPYLYVMVVEALHLMLHDVVALGLVHGFHVEHTDLEIIHLHYADDTILFVNADEEELKLVVAILLWFQICSGLKINLLKK